ncbi:MAG: glycosyltransferase family 2 protein [Microcystaceae cyanobacterium]
MNQAPVVLIIFNRPHTTQKVFEVIQKVQPSQLFVIADGPRKDKLDEPSKCRETRKIIEQIDWDCEVFKNYSDINLGCRDRVSSGLDWVFSHVNEAIILEDDCVPHLSFFRFCGELLDYYYDDQRIMMISGDNFQFGKSRTKYSYYFSRYPHTWGWATWKRAWKHYDNNMSLWPEVRKSNWLNTMVEDRKSATYWYNAFESTYKGDQTVWDYRWHLACWLQNGLTILPNVNLVSNIGFGEDATHTTGTNKRQNNLSVSEMIFPINHPPMVIRNYEADHYSQYTIFQRRLIDRIKFKLSQLLKINSF